MRTTAAIVLTAVLGASGAPADILEWRDEHGVRHYTNLRDEVPAEQRAAAQVVVDERVRRPAAAAPAAEPPPAPPEPRRQAQIVYDRSRVSGAYVEGLARGLEAGRAYRGAAGNVRITGPLAVATAPSVPYPYLPPYFPPLVTTSFDRGRSRHLTLRMLLQDQFAIDRDGPFAVAEPFGPARRRVPAAAVLTPFAPRGGSRRAPCATRVITR